MPLEATVIILDNSEFTRNGDYMPTRFEAQSDAVTTVFQTKIDSNPENTVGVMSMAGKAEVEQIHSPEVLVTHTKEMGQVLQAIHVASNKLGGSIDIPTAIAVAQLALKHRENKNLRQRIIVFVASPLEGKGTDESSLVKLGKKLKKNNVAVDVVAFGDGIEEGESGVLRKFVDAVNSGDNSHLLTVPPSSSLLSDALISSPILSADRSAGIPDELNPDVGGGAAAGSSSNNDFEFGVDPSLDPELAMALRMSMQEAQAREAATSPSSSSTSAPADSTPAPAAAAAAAATTTTSAPTEEDKAPAEPTDEEEETLLQQALAMSTEQDVDMDAEGDEDAMDEDEDAEIQRAIAMSMQENQEEEQRKK